MTPKKSHFNSDVFIHHCYVCSQTAEDVHHIKFQCQANANNIIESHIVKDVKSNLVPLCKQCHNEVHNGGLEIKGYIQTSNGIKLDYNFITADKLNEKKKGNKKLTDEQIDIIITLKKTNQKLKHKDALIYLEKNYNIKISISTYIKVIKEKY